MRYRCQPDIIEFSNKRWYGGRLLTDGSVTSDVARTALANAAQRASVSFGVKRDVGGSCYFGMDCLVSHHARRRNGTSLQNAVPAKAAVAIVKILVENGVPPEKTTYLCYYKAQMSMSENAFREATQELRGAETYMPRIQATVDERQGKEDDVIILDLVAGSCLPHKAPQVFQSVGLRQ